MPISSRWFQGAILTYLIGFTGLRLLAYLTYPGPAPGSRNGQRRRADRLHPQRRFQGMNVFQKYGLMEYGSVYGHGAYLGRDFTADYLHKTAEFLLREYEGKPVGGLSAREQVAVELHENNYDAAADRLEWSEARASAHRMMEQYVGGALPLFWLWAQAIFYANPRASTQGRAAGRALCAGGGVSPKLTAERGLPR